MALKYSLNIRSYSNRIKIDQFLRSEGYKIHTLRGNHEEMMLDSTINEQKLERWLKYGGKETLLSFGISSVTELPKKYLSFLKQTKFFIANNEYIFVHAGLNFDFQNPFEDKHAMLWIRDEYFDKEMINNRILIHGHTPIPFDVLNKQTKPNIINIDGGCVYLHKPGFGYLVALSLPDMQLISIKNID